MLTSLYQIVSDNWLLLLVGQYPNGPLGGFRGDAAAVDSGHWAGFSR